MKVITIDAKAKSLRARNETPCDRAGIGLPGQVDTDGPSDSQDSDSIREILVLQNTLRSYAEVHQIQELIVRSNAQANTERKIPEYFNPQAIKSLVQIKWTQ